MSTISISQLKYICERNDIRKYEISILTTAKDEYQFACAGTNINALEGDCKKFSGMIICVTLSMKKTYIRPVYHVHVPSVKIVRKKIQTKKTKQDV